MICGARSNWWQAGGSVSQEGSGGQPAPGSALADFAIGDSFKTAPAVSLSSRFDAQQSAFDSEIWLTRTRPDCARARDGLSSHPTGDAAASGRLIRRIEEDKRLLLRAGPAEYYKAQTMTAHRSDKATFATAMSIGAVSPL